MQAALDAIRTGDADELARLLRERPELARARFDGHRTLLHAVVDWPGHRPNAAASVAALAAAGADVDASFRGGPHEETPLHWAASSDDLEALDALLDAGAAIDIRGAVIGGGTPLNDATAFGQWNAARRLVERGATPTLWDASALGLAARVRELLADAPPADDITAAFWGACHGGQRETAELLLAVGADPAWIGWDELTPAQAAARSEAHDVVEWLRGL